jgi:hypothetical protein
MFINCRYSGGALIVISVGETAEGTEDLTDATDQRGLSVTIR